MTALQDKTALITGASRGIGRAIALRYAQEGADLVLAARTESDLMSLQSEIAAMGRRCEIIPIDLRQPQEIDALAKRSMDAFDHIDILVNNAGVGTWASVTEITLEDYNDMFDVNMRAVFLLTKALLPSMIERGDGHIVTIASTSSRWSYPEGTIYCASKFAVLGFNEALAKELRVTGVRATAICPGQVNTYLGGTRPEEWIDGMLNGKDVADLAVQAVTMPPHVLVTEMVVWPRAEEF